MCDEAPEIPLKINPQAFIMAGLACSWGGVGHIYNRTSRIKPRMAFARGKPAFSGQPDKPSRKLSPAMADLMPQRSCAFFSFCLSFFAGQNKKVTSALTTKLGCPFSDPRLKVTNF